MRLRRFLNEIGLFCVKTNVWADFDDCAGKAVLLMQRPMEGKHRRAHITCLYWESDVRARIPRRSRLFTLRVLRGR